MIPIVLAVALLNNEPTVQAWPTQGNRVVIQIKDDLGIPMEGISLAVAPWPANSESSCRCQSDESGRGEFIGIPPGFYALEARFPGREFAVTRELVIQEENWQASVSLYNVFCAFGFPDSALRKSDTQKVSNSHVTCRFKSRRKSSS